MLYLSMAQNKPKQRFTLKREICRFVALLFVLHALADVTVLQEYCGNETLGIPGYTQQVGIEKSKAEIAYNEPNGFKISDSRQQEQTPDVPTSDEDCFCCCSHTLLGFNPIESGSLITALKKSDANFSYRYRQSDTHAKLVFQPPKLA